MDETSKYVLADQVRLMYSQTKKVIVGGLVAGALYCAIFWQIIPHLYIFTWFGAICCLLALRGGLYVLFMRREVGTINFALWNRLFLIVTFIFSFAMGGTSFALHLTDDTTFHMLSIIWVVGYCALAISSYAMNRQAVLAVLVPALAITLVNILMVGGTLHFYMALALTIWACMMVITLLPVTQSMVKSFSLNHQLSLEIKKREKLEKRLRELSIKDGLTGLYNRRHFDDTYEKEMKRASRNQSAFSVIFIDVDSFKAFNDLYGHQAGDQCLRQVSDAIQAIVKRPTDCVARYGGEEIAVLLPDTSKEEAHTLAENMRTAVLDLALAHEGSAVPDCSQVSISIGVATLPPQSPKEQTDILKKADDALYRAKGEGRNKTVVSDTA